MSKKGIIIAGFPGVGKTYFTLNKDLPIKVVDSDSSKFSWLCDAYGNKTNLRNPDFPTNYIKHIKELLDNVDVVFCSTHSTVLDALRENDLKYVLVYPDYSLKKDFMERYRTRTTGINDENFCNMMEDNFDNFVKDCELRSMRDNEIRRILDNKEGGVKAVYTLDEDKPYIDLELINFFMSIPCLRN